MYKNSAVGKLPVFCPINHKQLTVFTNIITVGGTFIARCNGCDNEYLCQSCIDCKAKAQRYWEALHLAHPDYPASSLTDLPVEESLL